MEVGGEGSPSSSSKGNNNNNDNKYKSNWLERKARPQKEQALKCPRCNSSNTKFCYFNNYSLSQPRYFCKACRRYWTDVKKNKGSSSLSSSADDKKINGSDQTPKTNHHHNHDHLNFTTFPPTTNHHHFPSSTTFPHLLGSSMAAPSPQFDGGDGFGLHELIKPSLSLISDLERLESGGGECVNLHQNHHQDQDQTAVMFPIEDLKI